MRVATGIRYDQPLLFEDHTEVAADKRIPLAACRNYAGEFFEVLTVRVLGGYRVITNSKVTICPDIKIGANQYIECKSIGKGNAAMAYKSRLEKDKAFIRENGAELRYALWNHSYKCSEDESLESLRSGLAANVKSLTLVDFDVFAHLMEEGNLMVLNKANGVRSRTTGQRRGYGSHGYTHGYRTRLSKFQSLVEPVDVCGTFTVFGQTVEAFKMYEIKSCLL